MFYRRDIEDKKRPEPMRSFELDPIDSIETSGTSSQSNTFWFIGVVLLMLVVVVGVAFILRAYFSNKPEFVERTDANWAESAERFDSVESTSSESVPDIYELLDETKMLKAYVSANGGRDALYALETMQLQGRITWLGEEQPFQLTNQSSSRMRLTLAADGAEITYGFDGQTFWQASGGDAAEKEYSLVSESDQQRFFECRRFFEPLMAYALRGEGTLQVIEFGEWEGRTAVRVQIRGANFSRIDVFLDPQTLRVRGLIERVRNGGERLVAFDDFRKINGYYIPFSRQVSSGGELIYDMEIASCRINLDIAPSFYALPEELLDQVQ